MVIYIYSSDVTWSHSQDSWATDYMARHWLH